MPIEQVVKHMKSVAHRAAIHAGEIIRHHAAGGAGRLARRARAELAVARPQTRIDLVRDCPCCTHPCWPPRTRACSARHPLPPARGDLHLS